MSGANRSGLPTAALPTVHKEPLTPDGNGFTQIFGGMGNWYGHRIENETADIVYVQVFDVNDVAAAQAQGTPDFSIRIASSGADARDPSDTALYHFTKGLVIRASTTRTTQAAPASEPSVQFHISKKPNVIS